MARGKELETIINIKGKVDASVEKAFASVEKSAKGALKNLPKNAFNGAVNGLKMSVKALGAATAAAGAGLAAAGAAAVAFGADAVKAAASYDQAFRNMSTLVDETKVDLSQMSDDILKVSTETGIAAEDITNSVYSAISAGIAPEEAVEFAGKSAVLAAAGFTDIDTALSATAKTLNAYNMDATETDRIQKVLIQTQNLGITTVGELGQNLASVTPTAAAFGVTFEEVGASLAGMTAQGTPTAQATTQLNSLIAELGKSGTKAAKSLEQATKGTEYAGMSFAEMKEAGVDLGTIIGMIGDNAEQSGLSMVDMFSSIEAGKAALALNNSDFAGNLEAMGTDADVVGEAYDKVSGSYEHQLQVMQNAWQNFKIQVGQAILPYLTKLMQGAMPLLQGALEKALPMIESIVNTVMPVVSDLAEQLFPILSQIFDELMGKANDFIPQLISGAQEVAAVVFPVVQQIFTALQDTLIPIFQQIQPFLGEIAQKILEITPILGDVIALVMPVLGELYSSMIPNIMGAISGLLDIIKDVLSFIKNVFTGDWEAAWQNIVDLVEHIFSTFVNIMAAPINGAIALINKAIQCINNALGEITIPDWVPIFGGKTFKVNIPEIPFLAKGGTITSPTLAMVGEAGPETVVPHNNTPRSRALLAEAARGVYGNNSQNTYNITFAPNISGDNAGEIAELTMQKFKAFMAQYQRDNAREAWA